MGIVFVDEKHIDVASILRSPIDVNLQTVNTAAMKTTFDLPDPLLRRAKAVAADQGRPLRDLVADAIDEKLSSLADAKREKKGRSHEWKEFASRLQELPDGTFFNPDGIEDESFFTDLETIRSESRNWHPRNHFEDAAVRAVDDKTEHANRAKR